MFTFYFQYVRDILHFTVSVDHSCIRMTPQLMMQSKDTITNLTWVGLCCYCSYFRHQKSSSVTVWELVMFCPPPLVPLLALHAVTLHWGICGAGQHFLLSQFCLSFIKPRKFCTPSPSQSSTEGQIRTLYAPKESCCILRVGFANGDELKNLKIWWTTDNDKVVLCLHSKWLFLVVPSAHFRAKNSLKKSCLQDFTLPLKVC